MITVQQLRDLLNDTNGPISQGLQFWLADGTGGGIAAGDVEQMSGGAMEPVGVNILVALPEGYYLTTVKPQ